MVKGEPASGKTTFMKKICQEWSMLHTRNEEHVSAEIRDTLGQYDLLIPIILRLVKRGATLENTIKDQIDMNTKRLFTLRYMLKKTEKTVIVFDGLDEYNTNTSQDITDIIKGNTFKHVIITSRAEAANKTKEWKQITYKEAELKGFTDKHIKLYVDKYFKTSKELASSLISHIFQKDSNLLELARNPGSLCMVCTLHNDQIPIHAMNREQLYQEYVAFLLSRWEQRQNSEGEKTPRSEILNKYHTILLKCGKLANVNRKPYDEDGEYKHKSDDEDSMELSFTMNQIKSVVGEDAFNLGFLYKSHPSSRLVTSRFSFIHKTLYEFFLAYFIKHNNLDSFKQSLYKNRELLKQELSLTRFLLHLYMSPKEAYKFTSNILRSKSDKKLFKGLHNLFRSTQTDANANPDEDLFIVLLDLYKGYQHDEYQTTVTFNTTEKDDVLHEEREYSYIYQYPCYVIRADRRYHHLDLLSSYNKDMIRRMSTDNKHKAVTVPILQTAIFQVIECSDPLYISDFYVYCRADYEVTVTGGSSNLKALYLWGIEKMGDIHLNPVNDSLKVNIYNTNLHGCVGLTKPWMALIQELKMGMCKLEAGDISVIADSIQACTSPTGAESASPCRLQMLDLSGNSLTGAGADIARIIKLTRLCTEIDLRVCGLNDEDFYAIVNAVIQAGPATQLEKLQLGINHFTNIETVRLLLDNLPPSLCLLDLHANKFKEEDKQEIARLCKDKHPNLELKI